MCSHLYAVLRTLVLLCEPGEWMPSFIWEARVSFLPFDCHGVLSTAGIQPLLTYACPKEPPLHLTPNLTFYTLIQSCPPRSQFKKQLDLQKFL